DLLLDVVEHIALEHDPRAPDLGGRELALADHLGDGLFVDLEKAGGFGDVAGGHQPPPVARLIAAFARLIAGCVVALGSASSRPCSSSRSVIAASAAAIISSYSVSAGSPHQSSPSVWHDFSA